MHRFLTYLYPYLTFARWSKNEQQQPDPGANRLLQAGLGTRVDGLSDQQRGSSKWFRRGDGRRQLGLAFPVANNILSMSAVAYLGMLFLEPGVPADLISRALQSAAVAPWVSPPYEKLYGGMEATWCR